MKKNIVLLSALLVTSSLYASIPSLEGFYISAGAGLINSTFNMNQNVQLIAQPRSNILLVNDGKGYNKHNAGSIALGYLVHFMDPLAVGIEAVAGFGNTAFEKTESFQEFNSRFNLSGKTQGKLKNNFALLVKPGLFIGSETFLYGLVGPRWGRFETASEAAFLQTPSTGTTRSNVYSASSGTKTGVTAGVGIEYRFAERWSVGLEYAYTHYGKLPVAPIAQSAPLVFTNAVTGNSTSGGSLIDTPQAVTAKTTTIMLNISYKFQ